MPRSIAKRHYTAACPSATADPERPPLLLMTWSSDSRLTLHDLSSSSSLPASNNNSSPEPPPRLLPPPLLPVAACTPHRDFPIYCAAFSPEGEGAAADRPVRLVLGGGEAQPEPHEHEHEHGGEACSGGDGHDHHSHHHHEGHAKEGEDDETGPRTLLCYAFA